MRRDLSRRHPARVQRDDLVVETREAPSILADQHRVKAPMTIARYRQLQFAGIRQNGLAAVTIAVIASFFLRLRSQMMVHLGVEHPLRQTLLQLVNQTAGSRTPSPDLAPPKVAPAPHPRFLLPCSPPYLPPALTGFFVWLTNTKFPTPSLERALSGRGGRIEQPRAAQDASHGARRQRWSPLAYEQTRKLASAPRVARLVAQPDHRLFDFSRGACRTAPGPLGAIFETARARPRVTHQPLVAGLRRDPEAPAQLAPVHSRLQRQLHKLLAQQHPGNLPPRHPVHLPLEAQHAG